MEQTIKLVALDGFLQAQRSAPFAWGTNDCCMFAANAVRAMTGADIAEDFRDKYLDQDAAFMLIKAVTGGESVADAIAHCATKHGLQERLSVDGQPQPLMAQRGDLVAVSNGDTTIAGVVDLSGRYVACMGETGIVPLRLKSVVRAWRTA